MLLQIVVIFRISLQFTSIFGHLMGFKPFSQGAPFSPSCFNQINIRCKEEGKKSKRGNGKQKVPESQRN